MADDVPTDRLECLTATAATAVVPFAGRLAVLIELREGTFPRIALAVFENPSIVRSLANSESAVSRDRLLARSFIGSVVNARDVLTKAWVDINTISGRNFAVARCELDSTTVLAARTILSPVIPAFALPEQRIDGVAIPTLADDLVFARIPTDITLVLEHSEILFQGAAVAFIKFGVGAFLTSGSVFAHCCFLQHFGGRLQRPSGTIPDQCLLYSMHWCLLIVCTNAKLCLGA
ncbi:hypothetical protein [Natronococcus sp. A-GB7]|uniref:hypothetical protein n=1 Tax=Natronococcus sp. A-GB7 TaxID=3037649 RepID=UPI00241EACC4|nr:hypothetical protein [Natronococcus sp. A-GB7]MDG5821620.1 hypothetical protein [Natronococcus sp. A-GB7]